MVGGSALVLTEGRRPAKKLARSRSGTQKLRRCCIAKRLTEFLSRAEGTALLATLLLVVRWLWLSLLEGSLYPNCEAVGGGGDREGWRGAGLCCRLYPSCLAVGGGECCLREGGGGECCRLMREGGARGDSGLLYPWLLGAGGGGE